MLQCVIALATMFPPLFCITREAWDETSQVFRFQPSTGNAASECISRWGIMVLRCSVCIGWGSGSGKQPTVYEFVVPPVVLPSTSASNRYYALRYHQNCMSFQSCLHTLRERCSLKGYVMETDAAYGNEQLLACFLSKAPPGDHSIAWKASHSHKKTHAR